MILPTVTLALGEIGQYVFISRAAVADVMDADHVLTARAIGLRPLAVRRRHIVPSARLPMVTQIALNLGFVLGGAITVEALFSWPGIGLATLNAIQAKDFPMLQGLYLVTSLLVIVVQPTRRPPVRAASTRGCAPSERRPARRRPRSPAASTARAASAAGRAKRALVALTRTRRGQIGFVLLGAVPDHGDLRAVPRAAGSERGELVLDERRAEPRVALERALARHGRAGPRRALRGALRRAHLARRRRRGRAHLDDPRRADRHRRRLLRRLGRPHPHGDRRLGARDPVHPDGDRDREPARAPRRQLAARARERARARDRRARLGRARRASCAARC